MTRAAIAAAALALALAAAGCGGDDASPDRKPTISKGSLILRADRICAQAQRQTDALPPPAADPENPTGAGGLPSVATYFGRFETIFTRELSALRQLPDPARDAARWHEVLRRATAIATVVGTVADRANAGDAAGTVKAVGKLKPAGDRANHAAQAFGLKVCGRD